MTAILKVKDGNGNVIPIQAIKGEKGEKGDRGLPGSGGVPDGGTTGQVLTKNSNADGDAGWKDSSGGSYTLPIASSTTLGGVKIGSGISVGDDGTISASGGGSTTPRLIGKYVHSGNPVIQPTALDLTTGIFTCSGHGLSTGDKVMVIPDGSFAKIPFELCSTLMNSTNALSVRVVDTNTFVLRNGNTDITYPSTNNTTVDVSEWHIEKGTVQAFAINGFSAKEIKVILSGFMWGTNNYYLFVFAKDSNGYIQTKYGNNFGSTCNNNSMVTPFYNVEVSFGNSMKMNAVNLNCSTSEADYKYLQQYPQLMGYGSRSKANSATYMYALADHGDITEIVCQSSMTHWYDPLMLANGFTVEVYEIG